MENMEGSDMEGNQSKVHSADQIATSNQRCRCAIPDAKMHHVIKTADPEVQQLLLMCSEPNENQPKEIESTITYLLSGLVFLGHDKILT